MQQVSHTKLSTQPAPQKNSERNMFHEEIQFHEKKNQYRNFTKRKLNKPQVKRTNSALNKFHDQNQFRDEKNQHATNFTHKNQ